MWSIWSVKRLSLFVDGDRSIERFNYTVRRRGGKWPGETVQNYCPKALAVELTLDTKQGKSSRVETIVQGRQFRSERANRLVFCGGGWMDG
jgi:hypothetical protein